MESLIDPILHRVLSYLKFYEVTNLTPINKQFQRCVRKQLVLLVKPPNSNFIRRVIEINNDLFDDQGYVDCKDRFTCSGCSEMQIRKQLVVVTTATTGDETSDSRAEELESDEEGEYANEYKTQVCLRLKAEKGVKGGGVKSLNGKNVTLLVNGFFHYDPDGRYDMIRKVFEMDEYQSYLKIMFCSLIFMGRVLDKITDQILSSVIEKLKGDKQKEITLEDIRQAVSLVFPSNLATYVLAGGKDCLRAGNRRMAFNVDIVRSQILLKYPGIQFGNKTDVFLTGILEFTCAKIWQLAGDAAQDMQVVVVLVDHLITAIQGDLELSKLIKLQEFNPFWLANDTRQERLLNGTIKSEDSRFLVIETEYFPVELLGRVGRAQTLELNHLYQIQTTCIEGVLFADDFLPRDLRRSLLININKLATSQVTASNVRDLIDPALYSYIEGVSEFVPSNDLPLILHENVHDENSVNRDMWGREYEVSRFQSLATYIDSHKDGSWRFRNEINNLPKETNESLYLNFEEVFSLCIPYLEQVIGYARTLVRNKVDNDVEPYKLKDKSLQIICKIVEIELQPGQTYEGGWHVKGMPQENIIATIDYSLQRDETIIGADLQFKRWLLPQEVSAAVEDTNGQDQFGNSLLCPLGKVETKAGRLIVFPNSHLHKLFYMKNEGTIAAKRRNIVIHVINPEVRVVSTQEVSPKIQRELISAQEAHHYRQELMEEKKNHTQNWHIGSPFF